jgi:hypothetical protein
MTREDIDLRLAESLIYLTQENMYLRTQLTANNSVVEPNPNLDEDL